MANKKITDVDIVTSLDSDESFFINKNNAIKQINRNDIVFGISNGGTGATTPEQARLNLGVISAHPITVVLNAGEWNDNRQTVVVNSVDVDDISDGVIIISPNPSSHLEYSESCIYCIEQLGRELTFACDSVPTVDIIVNVAIFS